VDDSTDFLLVAGAGSLEVGERRLEVGDEDASHAQVAAAVIYSGVIEPDSNFSNSTWFRIRTYSGGVYERKRKASEIHALNTRTGSTIFITPCQLDQDAIYSVTDRIAVEQAPESGSTSVRYKGLIEAELKIRRPATLPWRACIASITNSITSWRERAETTEAETAPAPAPVPAVGSAWWPEEW
jgi:hypothetical protein